MLTMDSALYERKGRQRGASAAWDGMGSRETFHPEGPGGMEPPGLRRCWVLEEVP